MTGWTADVAESNEASYCVDMAALIDGEPEISPLDSAEIERRATEKAALAIAFILATILSHSNVRLAIRAYCIAHGLAGLSECTIEDQARELGVTKQALSKEVCWFRDVSGLRQSFGNLKTNEARNHYREAQLARYHGNCGTDC